ncbi:MAG: ABC transporter ATP-binding protein [Candidatus Omnitrophica bacterium]|nr:ABC transporter ATP-binding protein [Candidatus Omnitrophota bacterium]
MGAFIRNMMSQHPLLVVLNVGLLVLSSLSGMASIFSIAPLIDLFLHPDLANISSMTEKAFVLIRWFHLPVSQYTFLLFFLVTVLMNNGFFIASRYCMFRMKYAISLDLTLGSFQDFFNARWAFFSSNRQGTLLNTFLSEIQVVGNALGSIAFFVSSLFQLIFFMAVPFLLSWQLTLVCLATALLFAWPFFMLGRLNYRLGKRNTQTGNEVSSAIQESLGTAKVIMGFGNQHKSLAHIQKVYNDHIQITLKSQTLTAATPLVYEPLGMLVIVMALIVGQRFQLPLSELAVFLWALRSSVPLIGDIITRRNSLINFVPSYEQIQELRKKAIEQRQPSGTLQFTKLDREIRFDGFTFSYSEGPPVLANVNLCISKGKMVAIVGESGTGKSTLIDALMGFNTPCSGRITIDDVPLEQFDIHSYRHRIGYVPQDSILFNATIRENLEWSCEDATEAEIKRACVQANADGFIREFPDGYDTQVGDRGVRLSGGQCQRIALARAILKNPEVLILDEATSALDSHSERLIQEAIENIAGETTVVVIAHRLSTIVNADYVYVLRMGTVAEEGTYHELVGKGGHLSRMTKLQFIQAKG